MLRRYFKLLNTILTFIFLIFPNSLLSQDTLWVNTLNFNDITKRRDTYIFPDDTQNYRKILMYYSLKCDPRTAQDIYDCGEWDYLAYAIIHKHTGVFDSTLVNAPLYNWSRGFPETLPYTTEKTYNTYIKMNSNVSIDNVISENEYEFGRNTASMSLNNNPTRMQILFSKDYLKDNDMSGKSFSRLKFNSSSQGSILKNLKVKMILSSNRSLDEFESGNFKTLYEGDYTIENDGWNYINFTESFKSTSLQGFILQINYDAIENSDNINLAADSNDDCVVTEASDSYLEFDGVYDYTTTENNLNELQGNEKFTIEFWARVHQWKGGGYYFSIPGVMDLRTAEEYRQPRRYKFTFSDDIGYGILVAGAADYSSNWNHFAIVYDGTQSTYEDKLKFYINGSSIAGQYRGIFPDKIPDKDIILNLVNENYNMRCDIDEFRIWSDVLDAQTIKNWMYSSVNDNHPDLSSLVLNYNMDNPDPEMLEDIYNANISSRLIGAPVFRTLPIDDIIKNQQKSDLAPNLVLCEGEYESHSEESYDTTKVYNSPITLITYEIDGHGTKKQNIEYVYEPGTFYTYNPDGNIVDSMIVEASETLQNDTLKYYSEATEKIDNWEIARYITPYGLNLYLPPDGFTWIYDVTEYAPLLKGEVDLTAHNQQELIDLKFALIPGTPPRDVLRIDRPWGQYASASYKSLDEDSRYSETNVDLLPDTKNIMFRTRLTGHGHNSNTGDYPHCCEWKDNTHFLYANGEEYASFKIWRNYECGFNPVYPQGGTWPGQREGWCPGDIVYNYDFNITNYITNGSVSVDYAITPVPLDNQGMGNGNYHIAMQLFEFGEANHQNDSEVYDVIAPNNILYYSRMNPVCSGPYVVIRNNSDQLLTSLDFSYSVSGGQEEAYNWQGNLGPMEKDTIELPLESSDFWLGDDNHNFTVNISNPNGSQDDYADNDSYTTTFEMPDLYKNSMVIWYQTNNEPQYYTYEIKDLQGNVVFSKTGLSANQLYKDEINLPDGCYTLEFMSMRNTGLSYWAYTGQGNGYLRIYDNTGTLLKSFNPDFGVGIVYSFDLGGVLKVEDNGFNNLLSLYPNPANDKVNINLDYFVGKATMEIYNSNGQLMTEKDTYLNSKFSEQIDISEYTSGIYYVRFVNKEFDVVQKFVVEK